MRSRLVQLGWIIAPVITALAVMVLLLLVIDASNPAQQAGPAAVVEAFWKAISSQGELSGRKIANVVEFWIPLTLVSVGLVMTFRAGLWNIGVEGQMVFGGLFAAGVAFSSTITDPAVLLFLEIIAACLGGALWALVAGFLKTQFGVHEIFAGVALNAIANQFTRQLIATAWKPGDSDKAQYSRPIPKEGLFPGDAEDRISGLLQGLGIDPGFFNRFDVSLIAILLAIVSIVVVALLLGRSRWGLNLKATGKNARSALLMGVPVSLTALSAMAFCGALAGVGGAHRILFTDGQVVSGFSGGVGFLGLLVVLLVNMRLAWVPLIAFIFSILLAGGTQLQFLGLDSSLSGVLQGTLVLVVMLFSGLRDRLQARSNQQPEVPVTVETGPSTPAGTV